MQLHSREDLTCGGSSRPPGLLDSLLNNLTGMLYRCRRDDNFNFEFVSDGCQALTEYLPADLLEKQSPTFYDLVHPDDRGWLTAEINAAAESRQPFQFIYRIQTATGDVKWVWDQGRITPTGGREGFITDVTAHKQAEDALQQRTNYLQLQQVVAATAHEAESVEVAMQTALDLVCAYTHWPVGHVYFVSEEEPRELLPSNIWHVTDPVRYRLFQEATQTYRLGIGVCLPGQVLTTRRPAAILELSDHPDFPRAQFYKDTELNATVAVPICVGSETVAVLEFFWHEGPEPTQRLMQVLSFVGAQLGRVIERKRADDRIKHREKQFRALIENSSDVVTILERTGIIRYESPSVERILGYRPEDLVGRNAFDFIHPDDREFLVAEFAQKSMEPGATSAMQFRFRHKDGSWRMFEGLGKNLLDEPDFHGVIVNSRDVTERWKAQAELEYRLGLENLIAALSASFINLPVEAVSDAIDRALESIGIFTGVDRAYIFRIDERESEMSVTHEWCAADITSFRDELQNLPLATFPWFTKRILNSEVVHVPHPADLPAEAHAERQELEREGIRSLVCVPFTSSQSVAGFIGFDSVRADRQWTETEIRLLKLTGEMMINTLARAEAKGKLLAAHQALRASEERYRLLFTTMREGFALHEIICDEQGEPVDYRFLEVNAAFEELTGLKAGDVIGRSVYQVIPDLEKNWLKIYGSVAKTGKAIRTEQYSTPLHKHFEVFAYSPKPGQFATIFTDITARKENERQLRLQGQALAAAANGIMIAEASGKIFWVNPAFTQLTGYSASEVIGQTPRLLKSDHHDAAFYQQLWETVLAGKVWRGEIVNRHKHGHLYTEEMTVTPVTNTTGKVTHFIAIKQDISERKAADESLRGANRRLEQALTALKNTQQQVVQQERLRALGTMASGIAHDFNNALASILGFSELLINRPSTLEDRDKVMRFLQLINTAARDAGNIVNRLREFYRHRDAGEVFTQINLNDLVQEAVSLTQPKWKNQALAQGVTIEVVTSLADTLPSITGNAADLREVLTNLIFNAVDAMPDGGTITLTTRRANAHAILEIRDTGSGMSDEVRQRCFEPFFSTKGERGTGLGLSMVYGIIQRHDGSVKLASAIGQGTTFTIQFPLQTSKPHTPAPDAPESKTKAAALRLLLIEDEDTVRTVIQELLTGEGHTVTAAANGREGLEKFRAGEFDAVLVDRAMPGMNGDQVAVTIKSTGAKTPVIMLTGFGAMMQAAGEKPDGVDYVVGKPITLDALCRTLAEATRSSAG